MEGLFTKFHTTILLIIFVVTMCSIGLGLKEDFVVYDNQLRVNYPVKKIPEFNIDTQIENNQRHLGWKSFWRNNFSKEEANIDGIFTNKAFSTCSQTKLRFDGIYEKPPFKH